MRIRKNSELSSMLFATEDIPETYLCHLNQSPWDVIPVTSSSSTYDSVLTNIVDSSWFLSSPSSSSPPTFCHQLDGEDDELNVNVSLGDSNGASDSLVSVERLNLIPASEIYERSPGFEDQIHLSDYGNQKYKVVETNSPVKTSDDEDQVAVKMTTAPPKRGRPRGTVKKTVASAAASKNPYEFYYYSGFGPRWGRKRGGGSGYETIVSEKSSSSSDEEEEEEEDDDKTAAYGGGDNSYNDYDKESDEGKMNRKEKLTTKKKKIKSCRKPVKERSLQSLM